MPPKIPTNPQKNWEEKAAIRAGKPDQTVFNSEEQFDKIVENQYTVSTGNPGFLVQATALSY